MERPKKEVLLIKHIPTIKGAVTRSFHVST